MFIPYTELSESLLSHDAPSCFSFKSNSLFFSFSFFISNFSFICINWLHFVSASRHLSLAMAGFSFCHFWHVLLQLQLQQHMSGSLSFGHHLLSWPLQYLMLNNIKNTLLEGSCRKIAMKAPKWPERLRAVYNATESQISFYINNTFPFYSIRVQYNILSVLILSVHESYKRFNKVNTYNYVIGVTYIYICSTCMVCGNNEITKQEDYMGLDDVLDNRNVRYNVSHVYSNSSPKFQLTFNMYCSTNKAYICALLVQSRWSLKT